MLLLLLILPMARWMDCVTDDIRMLEIRADWRTAASEPSQGVVWHNRNLSHEGRKKRGKPKTVRVVIAPGVTTGKPRRFRAVLVGSPPGSPNTAPAAPIEMRVKFSWALRVPRRQYFWSFYRHRPFFLPSE